MVDRFIKDGKVAVLYSPGFGAGWSTWNDEDIVEELIFNKKLVELVLHGEALTEDIVLGALGISYNVNNYICCLSGGQLKVTWLPLGTKFYIDEYDGCESIITSDDFTHTA